MWRKPVTQKPVFRACIIMLLVSALLASMESAGADNPAVQAQPTATPDGGGTAKSARRLVIPPIRWWGSLSYDYTQEFSEEDSVSSQLVMGQINASTYVWAPWLAQVSGGLGLAFNTVDSENQQQGEVLTGNVRLNLFPVSRFPFEAYFDHNDSRQSGTVIGEHFTSTRYGFKQSYSPFRSNTRYHFSYDHTTQSRDATGDDKFDALNLEMSTQFKSHTFQADARWTENSSADGSLDNSYRSLSAQHTWRPQSRFSLENLANLTFTETGSGLTPVESTFLQVSSHGIWRDAANKWLVTGGARLFGFSTAASGTDTDIQSINLNLGANYMYSPTTRFFGNFNATQTEGSASSGLTTNQTLGASYQPAPIPMGKWTYLWSTSGSVSNRTGETDNGQHVSVQANHGIDRTYSLGERSNVTFNLSQNLSSDFDTVNESIHRVGHSFSTGWSYTEGAAQTIMRLSLSDSRSLSGQSQAFQLANLQISRNQQLSTRSGLTGNLTLQATKQEDNDGQVTESFTGSGDLVYQHQRAFNIPRLRFISQLRLNLSESETRNLGELTPAVREQETASWDNRFDYMIGRTTLSLSLRISRVDEKERELLMFRITRLFGDY